MQDHQPRFTELQETSFVTFLPCSINCSISRFYFCLTFTELTGEERVGLTFPLALTAKPLQISSGYGSVSQC